MTVDDDCDIDCYEQDYHDSNYSKTNALADQPPNQTQRSCKLGPMQWLGQQMHLFTKGPFPENHSEQSALQVNTPTQFGFRNTIIAQ